MAETGNIFRVTENSYYNEQLLFYIEKPDGWVFLPAPWAMNIRRKTALSNDEISRLLELAAVPFVYMQKPHGRDDIAYPTVQATCRYFEHPDRAKMEQLNRIQVQMFERQFQDFELIETRDNEQVSGCPAVMIRGSFTIRNETGNGFRCLGSSWSIFDNDIGYTVGFSGSLEDEPDYRADHEQILHSIVIGNRD